MTHLKLGATIHTFEYLLWLSGTMVTGITQDLKSEKGIDFPVDTGCMSSVICTGQFKSHTC